MRAGGKLSIYVSVAVADDLATIRRRYPQHGSNELVRLALARLADNARTELTERDARRIQEEAYGRLWN